MRNPKSALCVGVVSGLLVAGCAPISFVPGLRLGGTEAEVPTSWSADAVPEVVQLRAGGGFLPRVVNIWGVASDQRLYVSGDEGSGWVTRVASAPAVHVRMGDAVYALQATRVEAEDEILRVARAFIRKYREAILEFTEGEEPNPAELADGSVVFHLDRP
jgi:hypothetical protein